VGAKTDAPGLTSTDGCGIGCGADLHWSTPADTAGPTRSTYGLEGWGFESFRAHREGEAPDRRRRWSEAFVVGRGGTSLGRLGAKWEPSKVAGRTRTDASGI